MKRRLAGWFSLLVSAVLFAFGSIASAEPEKAVGDELGSNHPDTSRIDTAIRSTWQQLDIRPAAPCSDEVFVRRVYLDVIGTLPSSFEARAFLEDANPAKRSVLINRLLEREEFADYWAMRWSNLLRVKSEFPINLWPNAVQAYHHWIRAQIKENVPYDRFVRELLTASGSNIRKPQVNFYRAVQSKDAQTLAQTVALTFMGTRAEKWPKERLTNMSVFFSRVGYKTTAEWKEEIVFFDQSKTNTDAALPSHATFPDGKPVDLTAFRDPREIFADWLVSSSNPWFTRNIANRAWAWFLGRGIINEPDDIRDDNPPVNPDLLAALERELISSHYDLKHLYRVILNSQAYQLSCIPASTNALAEANFAFYPARRLEPEVLIDAINKITATPESYTSRIPEPFTFIPEDKPAISLPDSI